MDNRQDIFNKYMDAFVDLSFEQKCKEVIEKQKKIIALLISYSQTKNINIVLLKNKEVNDLTKENPTTDDYIEAIMVYTQEIEELYGQILSQ